MNIIDWLNVNFPSDYPEIIQGLSMALIIILIYDIVHLLFSAVLSWFKK